MKHLFKISAISMLIAVAPANAEPITLLGSGDFNWETTPEGVAVAPLQGDRLAESYQALVKLPAGTISPLHIKTANMYGIMLQGEMIHYVSKDNPDTARKIGPGSFYKIAKGVAHVSACVSDTPCVAYLYQDGAFDFQSVQQ